MLGDQLLAAIGDIAGHSLHAATVMAELRHAVRAYAVEGHRPGAVLERVNELMRTLLPAESATMCLLLLDPATGVACLASAGHLPPLVHTADGVEFLEHRAPLLGLRARRPADLTFTLPPGATLILYTDGLVERRDRDIDAGLAALADCVTEVEADLDAFCRRLLVQLGSAAHQDDDIAIVTIRRR